MRASTHPTGLRFGGTTVGWRVRRHTEMKTLDKVLLLRQYGRLRSKEPMRQYRNRLYAPERILALAERHATGEPTKREARRQYVVCVCAAFETYWREFVRVTIDRHRMPPTTFAHLKRMSFTLADVHCILGRKVTVGELMSCSFVFQGTQAVNAALSEILQLDLFGEFAKARFAITEVPDKTHDKRKPMAKAELFGRDILRSTCPDIERCFTVRHDTVHGSGALHRLPVDTPRLLANSVWQFNLFLGMHLEQLFSRLWGPEVKS